MSTQEHIIEHIVLFNVKPDVDPTKVAAMIDGLNSLASHHLPIYLSAGELLRSRSSSLTFSHILHCRFKSNDDLLAFDNSPDHARVVTELIQPIINDILNVDWVSIDNINDSPNPGWAMRVTLWKLKEGLVVKDEESKFFEMIEGIKNQFKAIEQISVGENFSAALAKGDSICSLVVFPGPADLEAFDSDAQLQKSLKEKVKDLVDNDLVVDYVIPLLKGC